MPQIEGSLIKTTNRSDMSNALDIQQSKATTKASPLKGLVVSKGDVCLIQDYQQYSMILS